MTDRMTALRRRVGDEPDEALLDDLLEDASVYILNFTLLEELPQALWPVQVQLAVMSYRRMGAEGQTSHEEGGVRMSFDAELNSIKEQLKRWRVGYVGMQRKASA